MNVYNHIAEKSHVENEMSKMNLPETVPLEELEKGAVGCTH